MIPTNVGVDSKNFLSWDNYEIKDTSKTKVELKRKKGKEVREITLIFVLVSQKYGGKIYIVSLRNYITIIV